jgi:GxxExxY protein
MNTDVIRSFSGLHDELTNKVLRVFYGVYNELGHGFLESVYHEAMRIALQQEGMQVGTQVPIPVYFRGHQIGTFKADLIVNDRVLIELKSLSVLDRSCEAQVLHYLQATHLEVALLLNFGPRPAIKRFILNNEKKKIRVHP